MWGVCRVAIPIHRCLPGLSPPPAQPADRFFCVGPFLPQARVRVCTYGDSIALASLGLPALKSCGVAMAQPQIWKFPSRLPPSPDLGFSPFHLWGSSMWTQAGVSKGLVPGSSFSLMGKTWHVWVCMLALPLPSWDLSNSLYLLQPGFSHHNQKVVNYVAGLWGGHHRRCVSTLSIVPGPPQAAAGVPSHPGSQQGLGKA